MKIWIVPTLIAISFLCSCQNQQLQKDFLIDEVDLIPEGVAVHNATGIIYVGSTYKRKIIQIDPTGKVSDFLPQEKDGIWSVLGMEVDEEKEVLWVNTAHINEVMPLINPSPTKHWMTTISAFDLKDGKRLKQYKLQDTTSAFNDLTLTPSGTVYATESANNKIFLINTEADSLAVFLALKDHHFPNGITYSQKHNSLFVACTEGVLKIDVPSKDYTLLTEGANVNAEGIDGLALHDDYLIGHQSSKVSRFYLNKDFTTITRMEVLDEGDEFDASTTGEIGVDYYYFFVNSQIRSGIDFQAKTIKPRDSLEQVIIRRIPL